MAVDVRWVMFLGEYWIQVRVNGGLPLYLTESTAIQLVPALRHVLTTTPPPWPDNDGRGH